MDVGDARTGVALTDPLQVIASPYAVVEEPSRAKAIAAIGRIVEEKAPVLIVVGLPLDQEGGRGPQAEKVAAFAEALRAEVGVDIVFEDERYTTAAAHEAMAEARVRRKKKKLVVDKIAAAYILQSYLDRVARASPPGEV